MTVCFFICTQVFGQSASLDYPSGRFQADKSPTVFRWSVFTEIDTLTLKIFHRNLDGTFDPVKNLIGRFDMMGDQRSKYWQKEALPIGRYIWRLEGYSVSNPKPIFQNDESFVIEPSAEFELTTKRAGLLVGFGRGDYVSVDSNYTVRYQTTPTIYGAVFRGGTFDGFWDVLASISDFTLKGSVNRTFSGYAAYSFRLNKPDVKRIDYFAGPSLLLLTYPRVVSSDGVNISLATVSQISPGFIFSTQLRLDQKITLYAQGKLNLPALSTAKLDTGFDQLGYGISTGLMFGQLWPLAVSGEFQYRIEKAATIDGNNRVGVSMSGWSLVSNLVYTF